MDNAGVLSGSAIKGFVSDGRIVIEPFTEARVNPGSYDLTLGKGIRVYTDVVYVDDYIEHAVRAGKRPNGAQFMPRKGAFSGDCPHYIDAARENETLFLEMEAGKPFLLKPNIGYLMHTAERVWTDSFVPVIDGKSSVGRLFAATHITAGYGEANFTGQYTLEVVVTHPVVVYPGMRFCQIRFHTIVGKKDQYAGNYTGKDALGPVASKAWKQIKDDGLLENT